MSDRLQSDRLHRQLWTRRIGFALQENPRTGRRASPCEPQRRSADAVRAHQARHALSNIGFKGARARELLMAKPSVALDIEIPSDVKSIEKFVELATRHC